MDEDRDTRGFFDIKRSPGPRYGMHVSARIDSTTGELVTSSEWVEIPESPRDALDSLPALATLHARPVPR